MRRWYVGLLAVIAVVAAPVAPPAAAAGDAPIGRIGETLRVQTGDIIADVTVLDIAPSEVPPGFGYPPRPPREQVYRANITVTAVKVPNPFLMSILFRFRGVTVTGDSYVPRNSDGGDALQYALQNAPQGSTVAGGVWWDCYRDLVSSVVLINPKTGFHLAQWNV